MEGSKTDQIKELSFKKLTEYKDIVSNPKWEKIDDQTCHMYKMEIDGKMAAKGITNVPFPMNEVVEFLKKEETLRQLDFQCIESKIIEELDKQQQLMLGYAAFKGMWPVSGRDFSNMMSVHRQESKVYLVSASVAHQKIPQVKGYVRGDCVCAGYLVQKVTENESKVTYLSFVDIKGSIPGMLKSRLAINQSKIVSRIRKNMAKLGK